MSWSCLLNIEVCEIKPPLLVLEFSGRDRQTGMRGKKSVPHSPPFTVHLVRSPLWLRLDHQVTLGSWWELSKCPISPLRQQGGLCPPQHPAPAWGLGTSESLVIFGRNNHCPLLSLSFVPSTLWTSHLYCPTTT